MADPRVRTSRGELRGAAHEGVAAFKGIPFAEPPIGPRRFRAPAPAQAWRGVRDASTFGPSAMQAPSGPLGEMIGIAAGPIDEDCLFLNVWTPGCDDRSRPVLVWIHGGGNVVGSGAQPRISGEYLARRGDVVVVTLNYRLGAFGFLHAPELDASGNQALLDQILALRWVREEIAAFGGDPGNVTVFGQSAGGFDIAQLMAMPAAAGCFDRMVPMSGSLRPPVPAETALTVTERFAERVGGVTALRGVAADELLRLQQEIGAAFGPVLDGEVIDTDPAERLAEGAWSAGLPLMIGHCANEWSLWTGLSKDQQAMDDVRLTQLAGNLLGKRATAAIELYRAVLPGAAPVDLWSAMMTDELFRMPAIRTAELHQRHGAPCWFYRFDYRSPAAEGKLGACHSLDIPFVFGTLHTEPMPRFCGTGPRVARLSEELMDTYLAFARCGDPGHDALPAWPHYDIEDRSTLVFDVPDSFVTSLPEDPLREFWLGSEP